MTDTRQDGRYIPESVPKSDVRYLDQQSQYGNRVGWGENPALLVVDMTVAFLEDCRTADDLLESTRRLLDTARSASSRSTSVAIRVGRDSPHGWPSIFPTGSGR